MNDDKAALVQKLTSKRSHSKIFAIVFVVTLLGGVLTGYALAATAPNVQTTSNNSTSGTETTAQVKNPAADSQTFSDFAVGVIQKKSTADYSEGTDMLIRDGADPVSLTSSVVDLSKYEGKKVKVYGQTQKALKAGWLMDVGKVELQQ